MTLSNNGVEVMGIRVHKKIGHFISKKNFKDVIVSDYENVLEQLDYDGEKEKDFFNEIFKDDMMKYLQKDYQKAIEEKKLHAYEMVNTVICNETIKGILICTKEHVQVARHDDLIDYYEEDYKDKIKPLNSPLYPATGFVYKGGLEKEFPNMERGFEVMNGTLASAMLEKTGYKVNSVSAKTQFKKIVKSGFFHPNIPSFIYTIAKAAKILENGVTKQDFNFLVEPSIIVTWG